MRPTFEPGEPYNYMFLLSPPEAKKLAGLLQKTRRELEKKIEKYRDIMDGGEATNRQQFIFFDSEEKLEVVERFIRMVIGKEDKVD